MTRRLLVLVATVLLTIIATVMPAGAHQPATATSPPPAPAGTGPVPAKQGITFGIGAATATAFDPRRDRLNYLVDPGSQLSDHIVLVNLGYKPVTMVVYTAEALNATNGTIGYQPRAEPGREARTWISIDHAGPSLGVTVAPRASKVLPISVRVPTTATPGDHVVGVMASVTSKVRTTSGQNPNLEQRIALRAFFRVSGVLKPQLTVAGLRASYAGTLNPVGTGTATVSYTVRNTGNVDLGGRQAVTISGLIGSTGSIKTLPQVPLLLPGGSYPVRVVVHHVWPEIFMHAKVTVTPLGAVGAANPALKPFSAETSFWAVPWSALILVVLILGLGFGRWRWRKAHPPSARHRPIDGTKIPVAAGKA